MDIDIHYRYCLQLTGCIYYANSSLSHGEATQKSSLDNPRFHGFGMLIISGDPGDWRLLSQLVFLRYCQPYFDAHHEANYSEGEY